MAPPSGGRYCNKVVQLARVDTHVMDFGQAACHSAIVKKRCTAGRFCQDVLLLFTAACMFVQGQGLEFGP